MMKKTLIKILLLLLFASLVYAGSNGSMVSQSGSPGKFVPTEKLKADDTVAFPVDI